MSGSEVRYRNRYWPSLIPPCIVIAIFAAGCARHPKVLPARYVRINALMHLSPLWPQLQELRRIQDQQNLIHPANLSNLAPLAALPTLFKSYQAALPALAALRQSRLKTDIAKYIKSFTSSLQSAYALDYARYEQTLRGKMRDLYKMEKDKLTNERNKQSIEAARQFNHPLFMLNLRKAAIQTQIQLPAGQARLDARTQEKIVDNQIAEMKSKQRQVLADNESRLNTEIAQLRTKYEKRLTLDLQNYRAQLNEQIVQKANEAASAQRKLAKQTAQMPPLAPPTASPLPGEPLLPLPKASINSRMLVRYQGALIADQISVFDDHAAAVSTLTKIIRRDLQQAAAQAARENGWILVSPDTPGAKDATNAVAKYLHSGRYTHALAY